MSTAEGFRGGAPVVVEYVHDEETAARGLEVHVSFGEPAWRRWFLRVAALYLVGVGTYMLTLLDQGLWALPLAGGFFAAAAFAMFGRRRVMLWRARRHHRRRPDSDRPLSVRIHDDGLDLSVEGLADASFRWAHVAKAVLAPDAVLLYIAADQYIHVPRRLLGEDQLTRLVEAVRELVREVRVVDTSLAPG